MNFSFCFDRWALEEIQYVYKNTETEVNFSQVTSLARGRHRYWWRMLVTKWVGYQFKMLVTVWAILVTNILYLLTWASGTNIQKMSPRS